MTIIETMLEKTKARRGAANGARGASLAPSHPLGRHDTESEAAPASLLRPLEVAIDAEAARENRLLLGGAASLKDRGAMAAYGMLRTRLLQRVRTKGWTTIGITSPAPQDGKSLTAVNLSLSLARERNSTIVLLDCDLCNPSVCHLLGIAAPIELREYLMQPALSAQELFVSIGVENLILAGNTAPTEHSAELLASGRLDELLDFVKRSVSNPLILLDLPPVVSPDDALVVAPKLDALLLVAAEGRTPRADLEKALELTASFPLAGLVLNRSSEMTRKYAYGYGYYGSTVPRG